MSELETGSSDERVQRPTGSNARSVTGILLTHTLLIPLNFAVSIAVARILGAHDRGLYAFLLLVGALVLPVVSFGFGPGVVYHLCKAPQRTPDVVVGCMTVGLLQGVLAAGAFYGLWRAGVLGVAGDALGLEHLIPVLAIAPLHGASEIAKRILTAHGWFAHLNVLNLVEALLSPALLALFVLALRLELTGAVAAIVCSRVALTVAVTTLLVRRTRPRLVFETRFVRAAAGYGVRAWWGTIATQSGRKLDWMLLGTFASPAALGAYSIASRIAELVWIVPDAAAAPLLNRLTRMTSGDARWELTARVHRVTAIVCIAGAAALGVGGFWVFPWLLGGSYDDTALLTAILLPGIVANIPAKLLTKFFGSSGHPGMMGRMGLVTGVVAAASYFIAIPMAGAIGAAAASVLTYTSTSLAGVWLFRSLTGKSIAPMFRPRADDFAWLRRQMASIRGTKGSAGN